MASLEYAEPQARESPAAFLADLGQAFAQALASVVDTELVVEEDTVAEDTAAVEKDTVLVEAVASVKAADQELVVVAIDPVVLVAEALAVVAASSPSMEVYLLDSYFHLIVAPKDSENSLVALAAELSPDEVFPHTVAVSQQIPLLSAP